MPAALLAYLTPERILRALAVFDATTGEKQARRPGNAGDYWLGAENDDVRDRASHVREPRLSLTERRET